MLASRDLRSFNWFNGMEGGGAGLGLLDSCLHDSAYFSDRRSWYSLLGKNWGGADVGGQGIVLLPLSHFLAIHRCEAESLLKRLVLHP